MKKILVSGAIFVGLFLTLWFFGWSASSLNEFRSNFISNIASSFRGPSGKEKAVPVSSPVDISKIDMQEEKSSNEEIKKSPPKPIKKVATTKKDSVLKPAVTSEREVASTSAKAVASSTAWCAFKTEGLPQSDVLINEIAWMGTPEDPEAEWIEIKNARGWEVDLKDWQLISQKGRMKIRLTEKKLQPGEFYLLARKVEEPEVKEDIFFKEELRNSGEWLKLFGPDCRFIDEVRADSGWPAGKKTSGLTMERKVAEAGWQTSFEPGGSPGRQNYIEQIVASTSEAVVEVSQPVGDGEGVVSKIILASVQIAGEGSDDDRVSIYNLGPDTVDISGWKLRKRSKSGSESSVKSLVGEISAGQYFVWANSKHPAGADATSTQTLSADNSLALLDAENKIIDALAWGSGHVNPFVEGSAFGENPGSGSVLVRKKIAGVFVDSGDNSVDFEVR